ncbi:putative nitrilase [Trematosphaeria pertusa]|uniref:nitrilase n=1 Tax=Trematosphaeria pertusa TaxID=390896 RepID=A0A6A6IGK8_9PLEO|nr:putative nitrilase [Trematosphaeria pertusa]KAF2249546.1 putative nitrilase [Trematosphaeria pertusa]
MSTKVRVGAVQGEPVWLNLEGSVGKTISLIKQAAADGVQVLGFPEVWIPGYPWGIWTTSVIGNVEMIHSYMANSLVKDSPQMRRIQETVHEAGMFVVLGYSERDGASLYMAQSFISPEGEIVHHRRKIKPTHVERTLWGDGQADSLKCVVDSSFGRIGGLNCWEHLQPLLRYYEYSQRVQIHVASWPAEFEMLDPAKQPWLYHETGEASYRASQFMAIEGQTFVLVASQIITEENLEKNNLLGNHVTKTPGGGFSMIFGPDGKPLCEPVSDGAEAILKADIDLTDIDYAKTFIDTVGHYARPDMLSLLVNPEAAKHVTLMK